MGTIIGLLTARGLSEPLARALSYAVLVLLLLGACAGLLTAYDRHVIAVHNQKLVTQSAKAADQAAGERATDTIATTRHEQELHDVIASQPDQPISPTSRALACKRLRDAGRAPPACR